MPEIRRVYEGEHQHEHQHQPGGDRQLIDMTPHGNCRVGEGTDTLVPVFTVIDVEV